MSRDRSATPPDFHEVEWTSESLLSDENSAPMEDASNPGKASFGRIGSMKSRMVRINDTPTVQSVQGAGAEGDEDDGPQGPSTPSAFASHNPFFNNSSLRSFSQDQSFRQSTESASPSIRSSHDVDEEVRAYESSDISNDPTARRETTATERSSARSNGDARDSMLWTRRTSQVSCAMHEHICSERGKRVDRRRNGRKRMDVVHPLVLRQVDFLEAIQIKELAAEHELEHEHEEGSSSVPPASGATQTPQSGPSIAAVTRMITQSKTMANAHLEMVNTHQRAVTPTHTHTQFELPTKDEVRTGDPSQQRATTGAASNNHAPSDGTDIIERAGERASRWLSLIVNSLIIPDKARDSGIFDIRNCARWASTRDFIPRHYHIVKPDGTLTGVNEASFLVHIVQAYTFKSVKPVPENFPADDRGYQRALASYKRRVASAEHMKQHTHEMRFNGLIYDIQTKKRITGNRFALSAVKRLPTEAISDEDEWEGRTEEEILREIMSKSAPGTGSEKTGDQEGMTDEDKRRVREIMFHMTRKRAMTQHQSSLEGSGIGSNDPQSPQAGKESHWRWPGGLHLYTTRRTIIVATYDLGKGQQSEACRIAVQKLARTMFMNGC